MYDNLVATGFLRMAPDPTWANITGYVPDRLDVIADEIDVLGSAVMGLTMKCARCHNHKYDPIPQRDYYRLVDIFKGAYDENDWLKPDVRPGLGPVSQDVTRRPAAALRHDRGAEGVGGTQREDPGGDRRAARGEGSGDVDAQVKALEAQRTPEPQIQALWDRGEPSPTYIYRRGDPLNPGRLVGPGVPSVLTDGKTPFEVEAAVARREEDGPAAGVRPLADPARPAADGARGRQPALEAPFRSGHRQDPGQLRQGRHAAHAPRAARLAGARVRPAGLEPQGDAPPDDDQRRLPAKFGRDGRPGEARPGQRLVFADAAGAAGCRAAVRHAAAGRRPAGRDALRPGGPRAGRAPTGW